jgi:hypothetical protein
VKLLSILSVPTDNYEFRNSPSNSLLQLPSTSLSSLLSYQLSWLMVLVIQPRGGSNRKHPIHCCNCHLPHCHLSSIMNLAGLWSSLYSLGSEPTDNTQFSAVTAIYLIAISPQLLAQLSGGLVIQPRGESIRKHRFQQFLYYCFRILCRGNVFTEPLPSNERLFWLHYSGLKSSCHNII